MGVSVRVATRAGRRQWAQARDGLDEQTCARWMHKGAATALASTAAADLDVASCERTAAGLDRRRLYMSQERLDDAGLEGDAILVDGEAKKLPSVCWPLSSFLTLLVGVSGF